MPPIAHATPLHPRGLDEDHRRWRLLRWPHSRREPRQDVRPLSRRRQKQSTVRPCRPFIGPHGPSFSDPTLHPIGFQAVSTHARRATSPFTRHLSMPSKCVTSSCRSGVPSLLGCKRSRVSPSPQASQGTQVSDLPAVSAYRSDSLSGASRVAVPSLAGQAS